jgi:predicted Zn finger-like uncharacterized protein
MPVEARCPSCHAACPVTEADVGKEVRCEKCEQVFTVKVKTRKPEKEDAANASPWMQDAEVAKAKGHSEQSGETAKHSRKADEDEADRDDDPGESAPPRRKRRERDDEPADRPPGPLAKKKSGRLGLILALAGGAAVVLLIGCGVGSWLLWDRFSDTPNVTPANFERVQLNEPLTQVESFFGRGREWSGAGVEALLNDPRLKAVNAHIKAVAANPQTFGITHWYRWTNGPATMFVGVDASGRVRVAGLVTISPHRTEYNLRQNV